MELPPALRSAVDRLLDGTPLTALKAAAEQLSGRYRGEVRDGTLHLTDDMKAKAYLAARLPATYAAMRSSIDAVAELCPDFSPETLLDIGAGPGTAAWAVKDRWPELKSATLVEGSAPIRRAGERLAAQADFSLAWLTADISRGLPDLRPADVVTLAYVLDELDPATIAPLAERLWSLTSGVLIVAEPGTPAGWRRILEVRDRLLTCGAQLVAPCPHHASCPLDAPDWCHFSRRVARSRMHRLTKSGEVPWEDEKFIYLAASRLPAMRPAARVVAPPRGSGGMVRLKLCQADGAAAEPTVTRRQGSAFKMARRLDWGDAVPEWDQGSG